MPTQVWVDAYAGTGRCLRRYWQALLDTVNCTRHSLSGFSCDSLLFYVYKEGSIQSKIRQIQYNQFPHVDSPALVNYCSLLLLTESHRAHLAKLSRMLSQVCQHTRFLEGYSTLTRIE